MKISRSDPLRRRRSPFSTLLILAVLLVAGLLAVAWVRGGSEPQHRIEIAVPPAALGH